MTLSIELFLLDNFLMNYLVLRLAAALAGSRLRLIQTALACAGGAVYAALFVSGRDVLAHPAAKLLLGAAMALPLFRSWRSFYKAVLLLYVSAFFMGGLMLALSMAFGGSMERGMLVGTTPVRVLLIGAAAGTGAPRLARLLLCAVLCRKKRVRVRMRFPDRTLELLAIADSGNLLTEPLSGLPVVIVRPGLLPPGGRPVPFETISGSGTVLAVRPGKTEALLSEWVELDCFAAESPTPLTGVDAILDSSLLEEDHAFNRTASTVSDPAVSKALSAAEKASVLHPFGGDASRAVPAGGGADVDRTADEG